MTPERRAELEALGSAAMVELYMQHGVDPSELHPVTTRPRIRHLVESLQDGLRELLEDRALIREAADGLVRWHENSGLDLRTAGTLQLLRGRLRGAG